MLLHYLIHQCQTDKALLYSRLQLFQLKLLVYFLYVCSAKKTALYIQKYNFGNDKGFSLKKKLFISALVLYICISCAKELRGKKYHIGAGSLLSLDLHQSFLKLNIKMHFWVFPPNYTVRFCFFLFHQKVKLLFPFALRFACSRLSKFSRCGSYLYWIIQSKIF